MTTDFLLHVVGPFTLLIAPPVKFFKRIHAQLNSYIYTGFINVVWQEYSMAR